MSADENIKEQDNKIDQYYYEDADHEQGATQQDFTDLTEPLSEVQSEIQFNIPPF